MIVEKIKYENNSIFDLKINRLQSSLQGRLNLLNLVGPLVDKNHIYLTIKNLKIDTENENEIEKYLLENTDYIESTLIKYFEDWILKNGKTHQVRRLLNHKKGKGKAA